MKKTLILTLIAVLLCCTSCLTTRTSLRGYKAVEGEEYTFERGKQCYLFWGAIPLGHTNVDTPDDGVCQIRTYYGPGDAIVTWLTGGIFCMQTIKVKAKRPYTADEIAKIEAKASKASKANKKSASKAAAPVEAPTIEPQTEQPAPIAAPAPVAKEEPKAEVAPVKEEQKVVTPKVAPQPEVKAEEPKVELKEEPKIVVTETSAQETKEAVKAAATEIATKIELSDELYDLNADGIITEDEKNTVQVIWNQADVNKDGVLDESEQSTFNRILSRVRKS